MSVMSRYDVIKWKRVTQPSCGEFTRHSEVELWCFLWSADKGSSKRSGRGWFETPSRSLWRHCNGKTDSYRLGYRLIHTWVLSVAYHPCSTVTTGISCFIKMEYSKLSLSNILFFFNIFPYVNIHPTINNYLSSRSNRLNCSIIKVFGFG